MLRAKMILYFENVCSISVFNSDEMSHNTFLICIINLFLGEARNSGAYVLGAWL